MTPRDVIPADLLPICDWMEDAACATHTRETITEARKLRDMLSAAGFVIVPQPIRLSAEARRELESWAKAMLASGIRKDRMCGQALNILLDQQRAMLAAAEPEKREDQDADIT